MTAYSQLFDHALTRLDPERAHRLGFGALRAARPALELGARARRTPGAPVHALGLTFPHVLGLAAGFDKNAEGIDALAALGFGHVEVGTVTAHPQPGNPVPRLFRLTADHAVINRMGFNNDGAQVVADRLIERARRRSRTDAPVLGINIGKTKVVDEADETAVLADYASSARLLAPHADYLVVNVSSPNTPGLRSLQAVERLGPLLERVRSVADQVADHRRVPLLVKIAPDLEDADMLAVADLALEVGLDGIIATNTTIARPDGTGGLRSSAAEVAAAGAGGLSGPPLTPRAVEVMRMLRARVGDRLTLVGVGGITSVEDARDRLAAGADLLQGYTAFVYQGPGWARRIVRGVG